MRNEQSLDGLCAALSYAIGIEPPARAAAPMQALCDYVDETLSGRKADRILIYNPDAVGQWIQEKYPELVKRTTGNTQLHIPLVTVSPSVTPVCFATMYTGAQPEVHGIREYAKPVVRIDTWFDALVRAGKKVALLARTNGTMAKIYLERPIDYFFYRTAEEINAKATQLIREDQYDVLVVYNSNYDTALHAYGPEDVRSLAELRVSDAAFGMFCNLVREYWPRHDTLVGFAMDHGCHPTPDGKGTHGEDIDEDMNILHHYQIFPGKRAEA